METITSAYGLKQAIQQTETRHAFQGQQLREQFQSTYQSLKPSSLLRSTLSKLIEPSSLTNLLLKTSLALATGIFAKSIIAGSSGNIVRRLIGSALQVAVTSTIAQPPASIKALGRNLFLQILSKKGKKTKSRDQ